MTLQKARDWADFWFKLCSIGAIIFSGYWAYFQFRIFEVREPNIQLTVATESLGYTADSRLLIIHAKPKNIGKVLVPMAHDGFVVTVRSVPTNLVAGAMDFEKLAKFYEVNLKDRFPKGYELEPGVEYDEIVVLVVLKGSMYAITATFDISADDEVDHTVIARVE